jgi:molecular chaperone GrpE
MMMKKKGKDQEEPMEEDKNKTIENNELNPDETSEKIDGQHETEQPENSGTAEECSTNKTTEADKAVADLRKTEEKLAEMQDKYLRLSAEFDNYRKRTLREKMDLSKYAAEDLFRKIIPIMDDFDRAVAHMSTATDCAAMKDGIDLIYNKFSEFLKQNGIREIESLNASFDVDLHDAVAKLPVEDDQKKGKVVDIVQKGYYLQDKVLRHSKVVVGE